MWHWWEVTMSPALGLVNQKGFIFQGTTADLSNPANFTTIDAGGDFNIVHSTMGTGCHGNSDTSPSQGQGSLLAHAFLYDVAQQQFLPDIVFPGSVSNTAYGIWYNGGTSYTICGGWSSDPVNNFDDQDRPIGQGYLVDYDSCHKPSRTGPRSSIHSGRTFSRTSKESAAWKMASTR